MLSRIAESLFWVGRYVERAEDVARILDVHVHHLLEDPSVQEEAACGALLAVMGVPEAPGKAKSAEREEAASPTAPRVDVERVTEVLAFDPRSTSSIVGALGAAHDNARGARDALSSDMWECLNATHNELPNQVVGARGAGSHAFFRYVKERGSIMAGLADSTMSRDDGWRFLVLGRSLERVDMTSRLLLARFTQPSGPSEWITTLRCCSAYEAFVRTYRRAVEPSLVAEFLLLDRLFPRSAFHALELAEHCLAQLEPNASRAGLDDEARRILGRARTQLEFRHVSELINDLPVHLHALQRSCAQAGDAVADRFFRQIAPLEWSPRSVPTDPVGWEEHPEVAESEPAERRA